MRNSAIAFVSFESIMMILFLLTWYLRFRSRSTFIPLNAMAVQALDGPLCPGADRWSIRERSLCDTATNVRRFFAGADHSTRLDRLFNRGFVGPAIANSEPVKVLRLSCGKNRFLN